MRTRKRITMMIIVQVVEAGSDSGAKCRWRCKPSIGRVVGFGRRETSSKLQPSFEDVRLPPNVFATSSSNGCPGRTKCSFTSFNHTIGLIQLYSHIKMVEPDTVLNPVQRTVFTLGRLDSGTAYIQMLQEYHGAVGAKLDSYLLTHAFSESMTVC